MKLISANHLVNGDIPPLKASLTPNAHPSPHAHPWSSSFPSTAPAPLPKRLSCRESSSSVCSVRKNALALGEPNSLGTGEEGGNTGEVGLESVDDGTDNAEMGVGCLVGIARGCVERLTAEKSSRWSRRESQDPMLTGFTYTSNLGGE